MPLLAPILAALIATAAAPVGVEAESAVVAPAARDPGLRIDQPAPLSILDWNDPEERRAHGLGEGAARRPVETFETALCELTADPRLQAGLLLPAPSSDIDPAEPAAPAVSLGGSACDSAMPLRRGSAFARSGLGSGDISPEQWTVIGGVTVTAPGPGPVDPNPMSSDHAVAPSAWGELSSHPGRIQQPAPRIRDRSDKVKYQVMRDTTLGFDGHLIRVRMTYPNLDKH
jgi:hypothetical protein